MDSNIVTYPKLIPAQSILFFTVISGGEYNFIIAFIISFDILVYLLAYELYTIIILSINSSTINCSICLLHCKICFATLFID